MSIKAVRCDGVVECKDNIDEKDCKVDKNILLVTIGLGLGILFILTILTVASVDINDTEEYKEILKRKDYVLKEIEEQGNLTEDLKKRI